MNEWHILDDDPPGWDTGFCRAEFRRLDGAIVTGEIEVDEAGGSDNCAFRFRPNQGVVIDVWTECDAWRPLL